MLLVLASHLLPVCALATSDEPLPASLQREAARPWQPVAHQVLFVCEHGNVKSLMAATYFNQIARERRLPFQAISRGVAPNSTTVPLAIANALRTEGFDVSAFQPAAVSRADVSASRRVVTIGAVLPQAIDAAGANIEQWNDVPPASVDYAGASAALKAHVSALIEQLSDH